MAELPLTPLHPDISGNVTAVSNAPVTFRSGLNTNIAAVEDKAQNAFAAIEKLQAALGNGCLTGGDLHAGTGLSVHAAALTALVGTWVGFDAEQTIGGLTDSATNYIFLRQDGTWTINTTGTDPSDTATHGAFLLWGTCACTGAQAGTPVNRRRQIGSFSGLYQPITIISTDSPFTASYERVIFADSTDGSITVNLPTAVSQTMPYTVKKLVAGNTVTIDPYSSQTVDGASTLALSGAADCAVLVSDGANWQIVSSHSL
jgi:hypothetical protein